MSGSRQGRSVGAGTQQGRCRDNATHVPERRTPEAGDVSTQGGGSLSTYPASLALPLERGFHSLFPKIGMFVLMQQ